MTLAGELAGAFVAGVGFTLIMLALFAGRLSRWAMRRMMSGMVKGATMSSSLKDVKITLDP